MKFHSNKTINTAIYAAVIVISCLVLSILIAFAEPYQRIQNSIYDSFFILRSKLVKKDITKTDDVVIVAIDDLSLNTFQERKHVLWPWPRMFHSIIAEHCISRGAKAVVFDIIFSNPDIDRANSTGEVNDKKFYKTIKETGKVIIPFNIDDTLKPDNIFNNIYSLTFENYIMARVTDPEVKKYLTGLYREEPEYLRYILVRELSDDERRKLWDTFIDIGYILTPNTISNYENYTTASHYSTLLQPYNLFYQENSNLGYVDIKGDFDGVIREYKPFVSIMNHPYPSLAASTYLLVQENKLPDDLNLNSKGNYIINWYGQGGVNNTYTYAPVLMIISDYINEKRGRPLQMEPDLFKDKVVFVGASARGLLDMKNTPFTSSEACPGVEIHATSYLNLVNKDWIKVFPFVFEIILYLLIIIILTFFGLNTKTPIKYSVSYYVIIAIMFLFYFAFFALFNVMFHIAFFVILILLAFILTQISNYVIVGRNRNKIKNALSTYLSPDLVKQVADSDKPLTVSGDNITATAMFVDIAGFTTFSEKNPVEKVVETLNLYLQRFSEVIMDNKGYINKYLGDGLMALFGAPSNFEDHADMAVKSAIECFNIKNELQEEYGLDVRIGVNSGKMIVGNLGGSKKLEYTAIGDSVNTASRLEGANKFFSTNILVGENTKNLLKADFGLTYSGKVELKGKDIPYGIYFFSNDNRNDIEHFELLMKAYESKDIKEFEAQIDYFRNHNNKFGPAIFYKAFYTQFKEKFGKPIKFTQK